MREESWGLGAGPPLPRQQASEAYLHDPGGGQPKQLWVKVEFAPWWKGLSELPDEDAPGSPRFTAAPGPSCSRPPPPPS